MDGEQDAEYEARKQAAEHAQAVVDAFNATPAPAAAPEPADVLPTDGQAPTGDEPPREPYPATETAGNEATVTADDEPETGTA